MNKFHAKQSQEEIDNLKNPPSIENKFVFRNAVGKLNSRLDNVEVEIQIQRHWNAEQKEIMKER